MPAGKLLGELCAASCNIQEYLRNRRRATAISMCVNTTAATIPPISAASFPSVPDPTAVVGNDIVDVVGVLVVVVVAVVVVAVYD